MHVVRPLLPARSSLWLTLFVAALLPGCAGSRPRRAPEVTEVKEARSAEPSCVQVSRGGGGKTRVLRCSGLDRDADGIDDAVDHCPDLPENHNDLEDTDGCPDPDADQDGYADDEDACPQVAGAPPDGCPRADQDADGIADHLDACPRDAEDLDGDQDMDGCPEGSEARVVARPLTERLWRSSLLAVRPGRAQLSAAGAEALAALVAELRAAQVPVTQLRITGFASVRETARGQARSLARHRLRGVVRILAAAGVPRDLLALSMRPLKAGGERVGRIEVSVFVPLHEGSGGTPLPPALAEPHEAPAAAAHASEALRIDSAASVPPDLTGPAPTAAAAAATADDDFDDLLAMPAGDADLPGGETQDPAAEGAWDDELLFVPDTGSEVADEDWDLSD